MKSWTLYGLLFVSVLIGAACESDSQEVRRTEPDSRQSTVGRPSSPSGMPGILFLGDSITAGYGLSREEAYPSLIQQRIDSLGWNIRVVNGGLSGDTSSGGLRRLDWLMGDQIDVLVVALGGNDGLRGIDPDAMRENLRGIIDRARQRNPEVVILLAGMRMPPNLGRAFTDRYERVFPEVAAEKGVILIPFLLEGVGGEPQLNQRDGIHPTAEGQRIIAHHVWQALQPVFTRVQADADPA